LPRFSTSEGNDRPRDREGPVACHAGGAGAAAPHERRPVRAENIVPVGRCGRVGSHVAPRAIVRGGAGDRCLRSRHDDRYDLRHAPATGGRERAAPGSADRRRFRTDRSRWQLAVARLQIYRKLAAALAEHDIASVRYDKRGIAASRAAVAGESDLRFETYVDDATAYVEKLRADQRFDRVTVVGHSEGSLIGMIAARRASASAFVSIAGAGFPAADVLVTQLTDRLASRPDLLAAAKSIIAELAAGRTVPANRVPPELAPLFHASVQPYLISWLAYDPRVEIAKLTCPVTIIQGSHDVQVGLDDAHALAAADPKATYVQIDELTHVLTDDPGTTLAQQLTGAYADASRPLDRKLVRTLVAACDGRS